MKKSVAVVLAGLFVGLAGLFAMPGESEAIPAFSREHKVACNFCHTGFPKLNGNGIAFKQNGYRMPEAPGTYFWEKETFPLAFRVNMSMPSFQDRRWNIKGTGPNQSVLNIPEGGAVTDGATGETRSNTTQLGFKLRNWQILSGGTLAPKVSYFFQVVGSLTGQSFDNFKFPGPDNEPGATEIETEALVVQIDDILPNALLNFRIGKDHIDNLFFSRPRRLTLASYTTMFQPLTGASLHANVVGLEFNGVHQESGIWYQVGVRNKHPRFDSRNNFDNRLAAWYAVLNIPFLEDQTFGFLFSSDEIGNENKGVGLPIALRGGEGRTYGIGGVLDLHWGDFNLIPAFYYYNEDGDIHFSSAAKLDKTDLEVLSGTVELHYSLMNELIGTLRWDWLDVVGQRGGVFEDDIDQYVASLAWYFHPNFRVVAEYSYMLAQLNRLTTFPFNNDLFVSVPGAYNSGVINNNNRADFKDTRLSLAIEFNF